MNALAVRISDTRPNGRERFVMTNGTIFWVDRRGWVFDGAHQPVPHPLVDDVMRAILTWERT